MIFCNVIGVCLSSGKSKCKFGVTHYPEVSLRSGMGSREVPRTCSSSAEGVHQAGMGINISRAVWAGDVGSD